MAVRSPTTNLTLRDYPLLYIDNLRKLLERYNKNKDKDLRLAVNKIVEDDSATVGKFPIIGLEWDNHREVALSLGSTSRKYNITMRANIWYYNEKLVPNSKTKDIQRAIGTITSIIRENPSINGFCYDTSILWSTIHARLIDKSYVASGVVLIESQKVIRQTVLNSTS